MTLLGKLLYIVLQSVSPADLLLTIKQLNEFRLWTLMFEITLNLQFGENLQYPFCNFF